MQRITPEHFATKRKLPIWNSMRITPDAFLAKCWKVDTMFYWVVYKVPNIFLLQFETIISIKHHIEEGTQKKLPKWSHIGLFLECNLLIKTSKVISYIDAFEFWIHIKMHYQAVPEIVQYSAIQDKFKLSWVSLKLQENI